jgi:hypothetical protein
MIIHKLLYRYAQDLLANAARKSGKNLRTAAKEISH